MTDALAPPPFTDASGMATDELTDVSETSGVAVDTDGPAERQPAEVLREALEDARVVMLTSALAGLHSRPLTLLNVDDAGGLWFLVDGREEWVKALIDAPMVDVSADLHGEGRWLSISGVAVLSDDRQVIRALWTPAARAFWESEEDPSIHVLRVDPSVVDIWHSTPSAIGRVLAIGKAILTGETDDPDVGHDLGHHDHIVFVDPATLEHVATGA